MTQDKVMIYDPATGDPAPYPSHAKQWREWHGNSAWLFNPWTGARRDARDIGSDVFGQAISDGTPSLPAAPAMDEAGFGMLVGFADEPEKAGA